MLPIQLPLSLRGDLADLKCWNFAGWGCGRGIWDVPVFELVLTVLITAIVTIVTIRASVRSARRETQRVLDADLKQRRAEHHRAEVSALAEYQSRAIQSLGDRDQQTSRARARARSRAAALLIGSHTPGRNLIQPALDALLLPLREPLPDKTDKDAAAEFAGRVIQSDNEARALLHRWGENPEHEAAQLQRELDGTEAINKQGVERKLVDVLKTLGLLG